MEAAPHPWPALGVLLMRDGLVEKDELEEILAEQRDSRQQRVSGRRLGEVLIQRGRVTPTQVAKLVAEQYEIPFLDIDVADIDVRVATMMSEDDARRLSALPIGRNGDGTFLLAIADPATVLFSDELRRLLDSVPRFAVVGPDAIERAITFVYNQALPPISVAPEPSESADDLILMPMDAAAAEVMFADPYSPTPAHSWPPLGALLLRDGLVTDNELEAALAQQRLAPSLRLGEILTGKGIVTRGVVARLVAEQYELPFYELDRVEIDPDVAGRLPEELAWRLKAVPIAAHEDGSLQIAIADPTNAVYTDDLHQELAVPLVFVVASPEDIEAALDRVYEPVLELPTEERDDIVPEHEEQRPSPPAAEALEITEPPHLVVEATTAEIDEPLTMEDEPQASGLELAENTVGDLTIEDTISDVPDLAPDLVPERTTIEDESWANRLELVENTVGDLVPDLVPEHAEHDVTELPWEPVAEMISPLELHAPAVEAEVVELHPEEADVEADFAEETAAARKPEDAEVCEFAWPNMPAEELPEPSLSDDLALQVAEAMVADVSGDPVVFDIFGLASRPAAEPAAASGSTVTEVSDEPVNTAVAYLPTTPDDVADEPTAIADEPEEVEAAPKTDVPVSDFAATVSNALAAGASAFHFSPRDDRLAVRVRIDGLMHDLGTATPEERDALVEQLESDGIARTHTVRTSRGAKTTLFVRERPGAPTSLDDLAFDSHAATEIRAALDRPAGAVLVCGPAGSGTTTTLYALLETLATSEQVVATVEQPIERLLDGVDQIDVTPDTTFAAVLRELRLTDTDAVLVGDLPDRETAVGALSAAYEGRLVVAGLHAPSAVAALLRLAGLGVEPTVLASSIGCVVSQRLVRTVCSDCRETYYASQEELELLGQPETASPRLLVRGAGCESCGGTGYSSRTAILEVLKVTDDLRGLIADGASARKLQKAAVAAGMSSLRDEGTRLCLDGVTTVTEVVRVLGEGS